jgi:hypothetical protein
MDAGPVADALRLISMGRLLPPSPPPPPHVDNKMESSKISKFLKESFITSLL